MYFLLYLTKSVIFQQSRFPLGVKVGGFDEWGFRPWISWECATILFTLLGRQKLWFNLTLDEVENQFVDFDKPPGSMNLDELLMSVWNADLNQFAGVDIDNTSPTDFFSASG